MRNLVLQFWLSLDGFSCEEDTELFRVMQQIDDAEAEAYVVARLRQAGTHIMGRDTFEGMARTWPTSADPIAAPMNDIPKVVFSSSLPSADWPTTRIARGDTAEEITRLKHEPGGEILAHGGTRFARSLIKLGVVDEYRLLILPVAVGQGAALFAGLTGPLTLRLVKSTAFPSGILELVYEPAAGQEPVSSR
jgi:dihydrofolate reductase